MTKGAGGVESRDLLGRDGPQGLLQEAGTQRTRLRTAAQQLRVHLGDCDGNAKRIFDDYEEYLRESKASSNLTVDLIVNSYKKSVRKQIDGSIEKQPIQIGAGSPVKGAVQTA